MKLGSEPTRPRRGPPPGPWWAGSEFSLGVNLPWQVYGCDFGANAWQPQGGLAAHPERRAALDRVLGGLAELGLRSLRWFVLCDGRAGLRLEAAGEPAGLDAAFWADFEVALDLVRKHELRLMPVLFDFLWFRPARRVNGVTLGGKKTLVRQAGRRAQLLDRVVAPLLRRYGREAAIAAWDAINEPEWATFGIGTLSLRGGLLARTMRTFVREVVHCIHAETTQAATVGSASLRSLPLVRGLGLDLYQAHFYERAVLHGRLERPVESYGLDRPLLLGEFATGGAGRPPEAIVETARRAGYAGALAWSVLARDAASDFGRFETFAREGGRRIAGAGASDAGSAAGAVDVGVDA